MCPDYPLSSPSLPVSYAVAKDVFYMQVTLVYSYKFEVMIKIL